MTMFVRTVKIKVDKLCILCFNICYSIGGGVMKAFFCNTLQMEKGKAPEPFCLVSKLNRCLLRSKKDDEDGR